MSTRALRTPFRSPTKPLAKMDADAPVLSKAGGMRLASLDAADMPWLGQGDAAMLTGYDGPEVSGPPDYQPGCTKRR